MIDYLFCAPSLAAAAADSAIGAFFVAGAWRGDVVNAGLQVWSDAGDVSGTDPASGQAFVTHAYLPGYWLTISANARDPALEASTYLVLGADRDAANAGAARTAYVVALGQGQSLEKFAGMHVSPLMEGANYPFG